MTLIISLYWYVTKKWGWWGKELIVGIVGTGDHENKEGMKNKHDKASVVWVQVPAEAKAGHFFYNDATPPFKCEHHPSPPTRISTYLTW